MQVPIISNSLCKQKYQKLDHFYTNSQFDKRVICAGGLGGQGTWKGDSGSLLMLPIRGNGTLLTNEFPFHQMGIVSYSSGFVRDDIPGVSCKLDKNETSKIRKRFGIILLNKIAIYSFEHT